MTNRVPVTTRVLLVCPHPDDETLAAGMLLQELAEGRAAVRVLYLTDGDRNPIPQWIAEGGWPWRASARARWAERRRSEALSALRVLGLPAESALFWGLPDQGLSQLTRIDGQMIVDRLRWLIHAFRPTLVVSPSTHDLHTDHVTAALLCARAIGASARVERIAHVVYRVHGRQCESRGAALMPVASGPRRSRKALALACHRTQLIASRTRMMRICERDECFVDFDADARAPRQGFRALRRLFHLLPVATPEAATRRPRIAIMDGDTESYPIAPV